MKTQTIKTNHALKGFLNSVDRFPQRPALECDGRVLSYQELFYEARLIARCVAEHQDGPNGYVGLFANHSVSSYAGITGILLSQNAYVPLALKNPDRRNISILSRVNLKILVVDSKNFPKALALVKKVQQPLVVLLDDETLLECARDECENHKFVCWKSKQNVPLNPDFSRLNGEGDAYVMFTSGTTGEPKGVSVSHKNLHAYVANICRLYDLKETDRFSQHPDISFDLSVHDIFVCFAVGGCLCSLPAFSLIGPGKFIEDHQITVWTSVPSVILFMKRFNMLKTGAYKSLRYSFFCGEALTVQAASLWQKAAAQSRVENLYGPTEGTVAVTRFHYRGKFSQEDNIVPIGKPFDDAQLCLIDAKGEEVKEGSIGELCLSGPQLTRGYFQDSVKTQEAYIRIKSKGRRLWYRTGDLACVDQDGQYHFKGRTNEQIKVLGHRVELKEIDLTLMKHPDVDQAVSFAWPFDQGAVRGIAACINSAKQVDKNEILDYVRGCLPDYMIPQKLIVLRQLPFNSNGKVDRAKLLEELKITT